MAAIRARRAGSDKSSKPGRCERGAPSDAIGFAERSVRAGCRRRAERGRCTEWASRAGWRRIARSRLRGTIADAAWSRRGDGDRRRSEGKCGSERGSPAECGRRPCERSGLSRVVGPAERSSRAECRRRAERGRCTEWASRAGWRRIARRRLRGAITYAAWSRRCDGDRRRSEGKRGSERGSPAECGRRPCERSGLSRVVGPAERSGRGEGDRGHHEGKRGSERGSRAERARCRVVRGSLAEADDPAW